MYMEHIVFHATADEHSTMYPFQSYTSTDSLAHSTPSRHMPSAMCDSPQRFEREKGGPPCLARVDKPVKKKTPLPPSGGQAHERTWPTAEMRQRRTRAYSIERYLESPRVRWNLAAEKNGAPSCIATIVPSQSESRSYLDDPRIHHCFECFPRV